jgi:HlyD family secretion protein
MPPEAIYRKEALDRLSTVPGTRARLRLVRPADGAALLALAALVVLGCAWLVFGRVAVRVDGAGILLGPRGQAPTAAVLAGLNQPAIVQQRTQLETRLAAARERDAQSESAWARELALERANLERRAIELDARIEALDGLSRTHGQTAARVASERRRRLRTQEEEARALVRLRDAEVAGAENLVGAGAATPRDVADARAAALAAHQALDELRDAIDALPLEDVQAARETDAIVAQTDQARADREAVAQRLLTLDRTDAERRALAADAVARLEDELEAVALALARQRTTAVGADVTSGAAEDPLWVVVFMDATAAKRVVPGMEIRVSPDSVERARYGSVIGSVTEVSDYPVTPLQADALLANASLAETFAHDGRAVMLIARLAPDPSTPTGYRWTTSGGPDAPLTAGTTVSATVTVERRRPITWLLPALRTLLGVEP